MIVCALRLCANVLPQPPSGGNRDHRTQAGNSDAYVIGNNVIHRVTADPGAVVPGGQDGCDDGCCGIFASVDGRAFAATLSSMRNRLRQEQIVSNHQIAVENPSHASRLLIEDNRDWDAQRMRRFHGNGSCIFAVAAHAWGGVPCPALHLRNEWPAAPFRSSYPQASTMK